MNRLSVLSNLCYMNQRYKGNKNTNKSDSMLFKPHYDEYDDCEKDFSASK